MHNNGCGTLYIVATPIGNLGDISARAAKTLEEVDFIAAEDTRVTGILLLNLGIKTPLVIYFEHNRKQSGERIIDRILAGESCALVTDAGTPAISDPGEDLVKLCAQACISVITIPGPCAAIAALSVSGLTTGRFTFEGFLSTSRKSRFEHLNQIKHEKRTMVFYEAPHKLLKTLIDMHEVLGDRQLTISRELTKIYEETLRTTFSEAIKHFSTRPPKGEFVLVIEGCSILEKPTIEDAAALASSYIKDGLSLKDAAKKAAEETGVAKNAIYNIVIKT